MKNNLPISLILSLLFVFIVDYSIGRSNYIKAIPYWPRNNDYTAAAYFIKKNGPSDICLIGSSRVRDGILVPQLLTSIQPEAPVLTVMNFGATGAGPAEQFFMVKRLMNASSKKPEIILYGVSAFQIRKTSAFTKFINISDLINLARNNYPEPFKLLPRAIKNELRYQSSLYAIKSSFPALKKGRENLGHVVYGPYGHELPTKLLIHKNHDIITHPPSEKVKNFVTTKFSKINRIDEEALVYLDKIISMCRKKNVRLLFFEMPVSDFLMDIVSRENYAKFQDIMTGYGKLDHVEYFKLSRIGFPVQDKYFYDYSHLNLEGAKLLTSLVAEKIIKPSLRNPVSSNSKSLSANFFLNRNVNLDFNQPLRHNPTFEKLATVRTLPAYIEGSRHQSSLPVTPF